MGRVRQGRIGRHGVVWANAVPKIVILTKVRTQGYVRRTDWLWVLTFVRMTAAA